MVLRFQASSLDRKIAQDEPTTAFIRRTETRWKALAPAIDPHYYPIEILLQLFESLPSPDVQITHVQSIGAPDFGRRRGEVALRSRISLPRR